MTLAESLAVKAEPANWHAIPAEEVLSRLGSSENGLTAAEAERRLREHGPNELTKARRASALETFLNQFKSILVLILLGATVVSALIGEVTDALVIAAILLANATLGFVQERRAERALEAMKKLTASKAHVIRDGERIELPAREVVPGDILVLEAGDRVAADARLLHVASLEMDESSLTGESTPVRKVTREFSPETPLADRGNMLYMSTNVMSGRGRAVVVATAMQTELGKIAELVQAEEQAETPLQRRLDRFGKQIGLIVVAVSAAIFVAETLEGQNPLEVFLIAVSLAVAAVPEGLPAVVTVTLALGVARMASKNSIVRRLSSVETLGSVTVICSDKTGTLTRNEMTVRQLYVDRRKIEVTGEGYKPEGRLLRDGVQVDSLRDEGLSRLMVAAALCNDAALVKEGGTWRIKGDTTEGALLVAAVKSGIKLDELRDSLPRIDEVPFSSERKRM
ncbi:MAG: HAD-IC family P-type ATPase, partial [Candidatus Bathyarchaeia archaeon]